MALARRDVLKATAAAGTVGIPTAAHAAYDPNARFDLVVSEVELHRNSAGRMLMARIYQPKGPGPFPTVLDLHGGAWNRKGRFAEEPMDRALAASGLLVVAVDMTIAPEAPYPACVLDANWSVRWLKANAGKWNGDVSKLGIYGSSSGGHVAELLALRPHDQRYGSLPLTTRPQPDASVAWVAMRSPVSDTFARYQNAERRKNENMIRNNKVFFSPWETIHEANPQEILERKEKVTLPPLLIMQGALDGNVLPEMQEKFANTYRAAGGSCDYRLFENAVHEWVAEPGPQTDKAREVAKEFIARQLKA
jgi:acetyl esterase